MRIRAIWMLGVALLMAGAAVFLARNWLQSQIPDQQAVDETPQIEIQQVVVAAAQFQFGTEIRREHLRVVDWPADAVPQGAFAAIEEILSEEEPRVALRTIEVNEPVLAGKISGFGGRASLSTLIAADMRATTVRVNDVNGVAGFVLPGDRVDILLTRGNRGKEDLVTDILLQNVKVLGIDQDANEQTDKPVVARSVTVEVTPEQTQKLTLAQQVGTLSLALRNLTNTAAEVAKTIGMADLRVGEVIVPTQPVSVVEKPAKAAVAVRKKVDVRNTVRIVRGLSPTEYTVEAEKNALPPAPVRPLPIAPAFLPQLAPAPVAAEVEKQVLKFPQAGSRAPLLAEDRAFVRPAAAVAGPPTQLLRTPQPVGLDEQLRRSP